MALGTSFRERWATVSADHATKHRGGLDQYIPHRHIGRVVVCLALVPFCISLILQARSHTQDPYRCGALVKHGSWPPYTRPPVEETLAYEQLETLYQEGRDPPPARSFEKWEPAGCRMHEYSRDDMRACLGGKRVLFVGDSTMRVLFFAALTRLEHEVAEQLLRTTFIEANPRHDLSIMSESVRLDFVWDPWLNSTAFEAELSRMIPGVRDGAAAANDSNLPPRPDLVVIGSVGLWAARNGGERFFETFQAATDHVALALAEPVMPVFEADEPAANYVFLAPVTVPRYDMLTPGRGETLSPARISRMNDYLGSLSLAVRSHILTAYNKMTDYLPEAYEDTGLHVSAAMAERWVDIPLNARCNGLLSRPSPDGPASLAYMTTCCVAYPGLVRGQNALICCLLLAAVVPVANFLVRRRQVSEAGLACLVLAITTLYTYTADRSHLFPKAERHVGTGGLLLSAIVAGALFMSSQRRVEPPVCPPFKVDKTTPAVRKPLPRAEFLPRHVSDEWKGLMQAAFVLLAYHDGGKTAILSRWTEFCTSSYLFLSSFGHTSYFLRTGDFSFGRVASVLMRLNLLPRILTLLLDGIHYGDQNSVSHIYSFPRLVSFWFLATYATLWTRSGGNRSRPDRLLARIGISAATVASLIFFPGKYGFFETVGRTGLYIVGAEWNAKDMRLAVALAWCAPFWGMAAAVAAQRSAVICDRMNGANIGRRHRIRPSQSDQDTVALGVGAPWIDRLLAAVLYPSELAAPLLPVAVLFCSVVFFVFVSFQVFSPVLDNAAHPLTTSIAVVSLAVLRNAHSEFRARFLRWPAVLGTFALELFVLQNHILLSGNGTGRLRLFSTHAISSEACDTRGKSMIRIVVATVELVEALSIWAVFLVVCWRAQQATRAITGLIFGESTDDHRNMATIAEKDISDLPQYDSIQQTPPRTTEAKPRSRLSDARLRGACILLLVWGLNRCYV